MPMSRRFGNYWSLASLNIVSWENDRVIKNESGFSADKQITVATLSFIIHFSAKETNKQKQNS